MSTPVITITENASILEAALLMKKKIIGCLVVVRDGFPEGIVTERDIVNKVVTNRLDPAKTQVAKIMTPGVKTVDVRSTILEVTKLMHQHQYRRIVVLDGKSIVGIITARDVIQLMST